MTCSASLCPLTSIRTVGPRPRAPVVGPASPVSTSLSPPRNRCGSSGRSSSRRVRSVRVLPSALCGSGGRVACLRRPYKRLCRAFAAAFFLCRARAAGVAENQTSNLRVGSSNLSERAKTAFAKLRASSLVATTTSKKPLSDGAFSHCWRSHAVAGRRSHACAGLPLKLPLGLS